MIRINLNEFSHREEEQEQEQSQLPPPTPPTETSSFPCPIFFHTPQGHGATDHHLYQHKQQEASELSSTGKSSPHDHSIPFQSSEQSPFDRYAREKRSHGSVSTQRSKMQLVRKMMGSDRVVSSTPIKIMRAPQDHRQLIIHGSNSSSGSSNSDSIIRACSDCNTIKTPLWRSGPRGPKSLCNACGIRQRKARRAAAAAAAAATGGSIVGDTPSEAQREKSSDGDRTVPYKKRWKFTA